MLLKMSEMNRLHKETIHTLDVLDVLLQLSFRVSKFVPQKVLENAYDHDHVGSRWE